MGPVARLAEAVDRAAGDDLFAELDEGIDDVAERHHLRSAAIERQRIDAESRLQRRVAEELVQHDLR